MSDKANIGKKAAALKAVQWVKDGMKVGLGTGSTAFYFIQALGKLCQEGLDIQIVASSKNTHLQAVELGIPLLEENEVVQLDITFDGADEIDSEKRMIKGGGAALLREKILASSSREMVVLVDESKLIKKIGQKPLPVEIISFCYKTTYEKISKLGFSTRLRLSDDKLPVITDNGNCIVDIDISTFRGDFKNLNFQLLAIPGVVETGLFLNHAGRVVIGKPDGSVMVIS